MSIRLKSKRKLVGKSVNTGSALKISKTTDLETRAMKELENLAKRQSESRVYKSPSLTVNKRSFAKSMVSVEKHNLKIKKCSVGKIIDSKAKFSAIAYAETDEQEPDKDETTHVNIECKIDLTEDEILNTEFLKNSSVKNKSMIK